ncbi:Efflux transporter, RND family, MFP subunit [Candidatus Sulfopaludibacter sp. SbA3]|nr:Efflux transporter, RND family, MFP subunit [Candidatus Sulfopaludibacter sp. SbA3]
MNEINTTEERLRGEIELLKRQLEEQKKRSASEEPSGKAPTFRSLLTVLALLAVLAVAGYYLGYLPRQRREQVLAAEAQSTSESLPMVNVVKVKRSSTTGNLVLPGNIQAVTEAPILARASGYIRKRYVDIGDRVQAGQVVAEIEAPELDQQIRQAKAAVDQANSGVQQAEASLQQGRSNENLARVTAERWKKLLDKGVVSRQDNDTYQMQWAAQQANVQALEKAVAAANSNAGAMEANVSRLNDLQSYQTVRSPFAGVITVRNIDTGVLVNEGNTLLYRVAQTDRLRTYLNVPQSDAESVRVGQTATLTIPDLPGRGFPGAVARTSHALDPASRTLLVEVQVANSSGQLVPGMYAQVDLSVPRKNPPLVIPGDTLVIRADGPQVAVLRPDGTVHFTRVELGRDFGATLEVLSGLEEGQLLVVNPSDATREGAKVNPVGSSEKAPAKKN